MSKFLWAPIPRYPTPFCTPVLNALLQASSVLLGHTAFRILKTCLPRYETISYVVGWLALITVVATLFLQDLRTGGYAYEYEEAIVNPDLRKLKYANLQVWRTQFQFTYHFAFGTALVSLSWATLIIHGLFSTSGNSKLVGPWTAKELYTCLWHVFCLLRQNTGDVVHQMFTSSSSHFLDIVGMGGPPPSQAVFALLLLGTIFAYMADAVLFNWHHSME